MYIYNPTSFDPLKVLPKHLHKFQDDARYLVYKIYDSQVFNGLSRTEYVPLKLIYLRKIISERKLPEIKDALISSGILETDGRWVRGHKSIGFRIGPKLKRSEIKKVEIKNKRLIKNLLKLRRPKPPEVKHLEKFLNKIEIEKDVIDNSLFKNEVIKLSVEMILDKQFRIIDDKYGRVHSNITTLKSELRRYLRYKNQRLINLDISNSQPLFLAILLNNYKSYSSEIVIDNIINNDATFLDVEKYKELCFSGDFYQFLADHRGVAVDGDLKRSVYRVFFGRHVESDEMTKTISFLFPNVYGAIRAFKRHNYKDLARLLQRVESDFMIKTVVGRFMREFPDVFITTIHDSILTIPEHVDLVRNLMLEEFAKIGIRPKLKMECY